MVTQDELRAWIEERGINQARAGEILGRGRVTINRWLSGEQAIPADFKLPMKVAPAESAGPVLEESLVMEPPTVRSYSWSGLTKAQRQALPPGSPGWIHGGGTLPIGQFIQRLDEPQTAPSGAVVTAILWRSNGVGRPSMVLLGDTKGAAYHEWPGLEVVPPESYQPARDFSPRDMNPKGGPHGGSRKAA